MAQSFWGRDRQSAFFDVRVFNPYAPCYRNSTLPQCYRSVYNSLIRPHLEYACTIWDPHLRKDIQALENVQKFALRVCSKSWSSDYATLLDTLSIPTLSDRRDTLKLCLLFNILTDRVTYPSCPTMFKHTPYANRHTNTVQLVVPELTQTSLNTHSSHPRLRDGTVYTLIQMALLH